MKNKQQTANKKYSPCRSFFFIEKELVSLNISETKEKY